MNGESPPDMHRYTCANFQELTEVVMKISEIKQLEKPFIELEDDIKDILKNKLFFKERIVEI